MHDSSERDACGVSEFCNRHGFSRAILYRLWRQGRGPKFMRIGTRRIISKEAAAEWRRAMENTGVAA